VEASAAVVFEQVAARALEEVLARIVRKASEGKRLSDSEVALLVMGLMLRRLDDLKIYVDKGFADGQDLKSYVDARFDDLKGYVDGRFNAVEGRLGAVEKRLDSVEGRLDTIYSEVSSIKTDIIKMMRELLEKAYGERKS
jgi:DNA-binding FrmR family transcriptional regulator